MLTKLDKDDKDIQISTLIYCMGPEAEQLFKNFTFATEDDKQDPMKVMEKFDQHFIPKRNIIFERARFNQRSQEPGESIEGYVCALYDLVQHCNYGVNKDDFIHDRLVIGLLAKETLQILQMEPNLTLQSAIETCRHRELIRKQNTIKRNTLISEMVCEIWRN